MRRNPVKHNATFPLKILVGNSEIHNRIVPKKNRAGFLCSRSGLLVLIVEQGKYSAKSLFDFVRVVLGSH